MPEPIAIPLAEVSRVGEARRVASSTAARLGFDEAGRGRVALVVTEAATNVVKHARGGELLLDPVARDGVDGLEVLALDKGPGMADVGRCMADGYSTAGSPGNGLGAMARLADDFDVFSAPGLGTAVLARLWSRPDRRARAAVGLEVGSARRPYPGEFVTGDAWASAESDGKTLVLVADGLGHGPRAAEAASEAVRAFREHAALGPVEVLKAAHQILRGTRGAVAAVAEVDPARGTVRFAGVGNIAGAVLDGDAARSMVSFPGTLGHEARKFQEFSYAWSPRSLLVLHSDGLTGHWRLGRYPGLSARDPSLVAGVLYRDFTRGRDDATVVVAREMQSHAIP